jgi:hypothetical protein
MSKAKLKENGEVALEVSILTTSTPGPAVAKRGGFGLVRFVSPRSLDVRNSYALELDPGNFAEITIEDEQQAYPGTTVNVVAHFVV